VRSRDALGRRRSCCRQRAASASQIGRFETEWLASGKNFVALTDLCGRWIDHVHGQRPHKAIVLDMDTSVSPTDGEQEGTSCNGHSGCTCYRPLFVFKPVRRSGTHFESGNVHSADGWHDVLEPVVARDKKRNMRRYFRSDAAFAKPRGLRIPRSGRIQVCDPPPCQSGALYPRVGFVVTNLSRPTESVIGFYNQRGTAEQWIKEGKNAMKWTWLSCCTFAANAVRLQLRALAYNLPNFVRTLALPDAVKHWSLTSLREKLVKIGAKDRHTRAVRDLPNGGGRRAEPVVRGDSTADRWTATAIGALAPFAAIVLTHSALATDE
jgi:Transposase DDE domain group 1